MPDDEEEKAEEKTLAQEIVAQSITDEMKKSYIDYAMSVIIGRALPDVRDGLKPVHRRILFAMNEMGNTHDKPYKKSARTVGEVLGKFHPHGDQAVYETMVRMAQDFSLRYPLIQGHGNFGSVDGDSAAAMRYTEARLAKISVELLSDLEKSTVNFVPNFDASMEEPTVMPAKLPNLLINGSSGIAVGMATNIPPHNLCEVVDALVAMIEFPDIDLMELLEIIRGPDFPTGGIIQGIAGIVEAYKTGKGTVKVRSRAHFEERKGGKRIVVTEIPYMVNKSSMLEDIANLVKEKKVEGITDLRDESDKSGMRVVIDLRTDAFEEVILNQLFSHTNLESSFGINMVAIVDGEPKILPIKKALGCFLDFREEVVRRRTQWELDKAEEREHILKGLIVALKNIDDVISIIRKSKDPAQAQERLIKKFKLSEKQVKAVLDMRLQKLTSLEIDNINKEEKEIAKKIKELKEILAKKELILDIIKKELLDIREKYGDERRTEIVQISSDLEVEDLIPNEKVIIQITNRGYIKRQPVALFKAQRRGGVGLIGMTTREEDYVVDTFATRAHNYIMFFTNLGKCYWLKAYKIPKAGSRYTAGKAVVNLLAHLEKDEHINSMIPIPEFDDKHYLIFATKKGQIKKTPLSAYSHIRVTGIKAIKIYEGDELVGTKLSSGDQEVILATRQGKAIRFSERDVRSMGRVSHGVRGIKLRGKDEVVSMALADPESVLLTITSKGYGKRTQAKAYRKTRRGGIGVANLKITEKNGEVVQTVRVNENDEVLITSKLGMMIRMPIKDIPVKKGRAVMGVRVMRLKKEDDEVIALAKLVSEEQVEEIEKEAEENGEAVIEEKPKSRRGRPRKK
jgi:DNA gyrase subunit A